MYIHVAPSSGHISLNFNMHFKLILRSSEGFFWCLEWECCIFLKDWWKFIQIHQYYMYTMALKRTTQNKQTSQLCLLFTYLLKSFWSSAATGLSENLSCRLPSGLPRWLMRTIDLAPWSKMYLMLGSAAVILVTERQSILVTKIFTPQEQDQTFKDLWSIIHMLSPSL